METLSALLAICAGNLPVPCEFPTQRPVTRSFDVFFDLHPNKRLSKQWWGWWFEMPSCPLWRHRNDLTRTSHDIARTVCLFLVIYCVCSGRMNMVFDVRVGRSHATIPCNKHIHHMSIYIIRALNVTSLAKRNKTNKNKLKDAPMPPNVCSPNAAYMRQWTVSALVQVMACRLFGSKPLPEPM